MGHWGRGQRLQAGSLAYHGESGGGLRSSHLMPGWTGQVGCVGSWRPVRVKGGGRHVAVGAGRPQDAARAPNHWAHGEAWHVVTQICLGQAGLFIFVVLMVQGRLAGEGRVQEPDSNT